MQDIAARVINEIARSRLTPLLQGANAISAAAYLKVAFTETPRSRRGLAHLELAQQRTAALEFELDRHPAALLERRMRLHQHQMHSAGLQHRRAVGRDAQL